MSVKDFPWLVALRNKKPLSQQKFLHFHWDRGIISCGTTQIGVNAHSSTYKNMCYLENGRKSRQALLSLAAVRPALDYFL